MSKSVLVVDTPKNCYDCPFGAEYCGNLGYEGCCELAGCLNSDMRLITEELYDYECESRPDWCPLKPLLEKFDNEKEWKLGDFEPLFKIGWNACIDEITGGVDSDD